MGYNFNMEQSAPEFSWHAGCLSHSPTTRNATQEPIHNIPYLSYTVTVELPKRYLYSKDKYKIT